MAFHNTFQNRSAENKKKKEFLVILLISAIILSSILFYSYIIYYPYKLSSFPRTINININGEIKFGEYSDCTFEVDDKDSSDPVEVLNGRIKIRGHTNAKDRVPKKEYRLELSQQKSLFGMRKDDDWLLLAMYFDFPRMRIKMSLDLWRSLEPVNPTTILPDSEYVLLYINGELQGLYLLTEELDRKLFSLDDPQNNIYSSLIFQLRLAENLNEYHNLKWDQDWPNEDEGYKIMDEILSELIFFITNSSDEVFFNPEIGIYSLFDKQNLIDFLLFNFFINHKDFWNVNYYIVRNSYPSKFYLIPWDFDGSFGQRGWIIFDFDDNPESTIFQENRLFQRLLNNQDFRRECRNRWSDLREDLWTEENLLDTLSEVYESIKTLIELDTDLWKPITVNDDSLVYNRYLYSTKEFDLEEYIDKLFEFIPERLAFCDEYFLELI